MRRKLMVIIPNDKKTHETLDIIPNAKKTNKNLCVKTNAIHDTPSSVAFLRSIVAIIQGLRHFTWGTHILMLIEALN